MPTLSRRERPGGRDVAAGAATRAALQNPRLLFVEDDFGLRANLAELLLLEGYEVACAADGSEAIRRLYDGPAPAAILLDIMLPRIDGVAFRRIQMRSESVRDIPTIAMTANRNLSSLADLGFCKVLPKPIDVDVLLDVLAKVCRKHDEEPRA
jgi:two-component system, chemotaxis family, chemotaxis protein CheY